MADPTDTDNVAHGPTLEASAPSVDFRTRPDRYRHWRLTVEGPVARLILDVQEDGGLAPGYQLKLNSYDLGVDIELYDAVQRLRFEHPEVTVATISSGKDRVFCAGANIRMLAASSHAWKVNFCKFTNETRNSIEESSAHSGLRWLAVLDGTASGGGYELALACDHILLVDDGSSAVSLPEVPLLGVLPGTGGLTRVVDKRRVRRDLADVFATKAEGIRGRTAVEWRLVDELAPRSSLPAAVAARIEALAATARGGRGTGSEPVRGIAMPDLERTITDNGIAYRHISADLDRVLGVAAIEVRGPSGPQPTTAAELVEQGAETWALACARELDDLILHLRTNEPELGTWTVRAVGSDDAVLASDGFLAGLAGTATRSAAAAAGGGAPDASEECWLAREIVLYWKRTLSRLDLTSRSIFALADEGTCFAGTLLELGLAADRLYLLDGGAPPPSIQATVMNFGAYPMANGMSRLATRFFGDPDGVHAVADQIGVPLDAAGATKLGLVTAAPDDIDWEDEVRLALEERASFSPDALTGMEASLRFPGPETLHTKIFGRLSAWQNWIFQRPNAAGPEGALRVYGTGRRASFDRKRV